MKPHTEPRAPPGPVVRLSAECRATILEAYPQPAATEMLLNLEIYLDRLNSQGRYKDASDILRESEAGARADIQKRSKQKSRDVLKLIGTSTFTASVGVVVKFISSKIGIS